MEKKRTRRVRSIRGSIFDLREANQASGGEAVELVDLRKVERLFYELETAIEHAWRHER